MRPTQKQKKAIEKLMKEMPDAVILGFGNWDDLSDEERDRAIEYYRQQNEKGEDRNGN